MCGRNSVAKQLPPRLGVNVDPTEQLMLMSTTLRTQQKYQSCAHKIMNTINTEQRYVATPITLFTFSFRQYGGE